jgi:hypothetical protein
MIDCVNCGGPVHAEAVGCPACGADPATGVVPESVQRLSGQAGGGGATSGVRLLRPEPEGIGGWLVLPLIGLILSPFMVFYGLWIDILPCFRPEVWTALTTPGAPLYSSYWPVYLVGATILAAGVMVWAVVVLVFFLQRRRQVPVFISALYLANIAVAVFDFASMLYLDGQVPLLYADGEGSAPLLGTVFRAAIGAAIWIPYFFRSVRVRNTFVR